MPLRLALPGLALLATVLLTGPCAAQSLQGAPEPGSMAVGSAPTPAAELPRLVFDDLRYAAAEWTSQVDRPVAEGSVFGRAPWCLSLACPDTLTTRAWYQYLWRELGFSNVDPLARIEADTAGTGTLGFALLPGDHPDTWPLQVASGFTARTGVWAARADFSELPDADAVRVMQSFWTLAPNETVKTPDAGRYRGPARGRTEVDFELNNWFGHADGVERYMETISFPNSEQGRSAPLRAEAGAPDHSCRLRDGDGDRLAVPADCAAFLVADGVWTTMLFRTDGRSMRFELRADGPEGSLTAASDVVRGEAPTQRMMTMLSQYARLPAGASRWTTDRDIRVAFDWTYYAMTPTRALDAVLADVAAVRAARVDGRPIDRIRTAPLRLARPARPAPGTYSGLSMFAVQAPRLEGPQTLPPGRAATYVLHLDDRVGTYRILWAERHVDADGRVGAWTTPEALHGYRYPTVMPADARCLDLRAEVVEMIYTPVETDGATAVDWVPDAVPPEVARRRVCPPGTASALRAAAP